MTHSNITGNVTVIINKANTARFETTLSGSGGPRRRERSWYAMNLLGLGFNDYLIQTNKSLTVVSCAVVVDVAGSVAVVVVSVKQ